MSSFLLKIIALIAMTIDHSGKVLATDSSVFNLIGRVAFPIFAFQIVEGYFYTKNIKKYLLRLFIVAIIAEVPFYYLFGGIDTIFTLLAGLICIIIYEREKDKLISFSMILTILACSFVLGFDYGFYGILVILLFYLFRDSKIKKSIAFSILMIIHYLIPIFTYHEIYYFFALLTTLSSLIFINMYNYERGPSLKYLFYIYYPLHLYLLFIIQLFIKK